tara:strand:+ start:284 stop:469 length:186 start_codon:yes stop_codon:yes gene_type:complete
MSVQTNFRAQDMLGIAKPVAKKAAPAPRRFEAPKPEVAVEEVVVVEETVEAPVVEDSPSED